MELLNAAAVVLFTTQRHAWVSREQVITVKNLSMTVQDIKPNCTILPSLQDETCFENESLPICKESDVQNEIIIGVIRPLIASLAGAVVGALITRKCCEKSGDVKINTSSPTYGSNHNENSILINAEPTHADTSSQDGDQGIDDTAALNITH